eukprot:1146100-Pelagomonas_calceolata.AAC.5
MGNQASMKTTGTVNSAQELLDIPRRETSTKWKKISNRNVTSRDIARLSTKQYCLRDRLQACASRDRGKTYLIIGSASTSSAYRVIQRNESTIQARQPVHTGHAYANFELSQIVDHISHIPDLSKACWCTQHMIQARLARVLTPAGRHLRHQPNNKACQSTQHMSKACRCTKHLSNPIQARPA